MVKLLGLGVAALVALAPAVVGLVGNPSLSQQVQLNTGAGGGSDRGGVLQPTAHESRGAGNGGKVGGHTGPGDDHVGERGRSPSGGLSEPPATSSSPYVPTGSQRSSGAQGSNRSGESGTSESSGPSSGSGTSSGPTSGGSSSGPGGGGTSSSSGSGSSGGGHLADLSVNRGGDATGAGGGNHGADGGTGDR